MIDEIIFKKLKIDTPVIYGLMLKSWGLASNLAIAYLIVNNFTPEIQGYYYAFASLLTLQAFAELGLGAVIMQHSAHEWAKLKLLKNERIDGDLRSLSRLGSLLKIAIKWYTTASIVVFLSLSIGGIFYFSASNEQLSVNWKAPWICITLLTAINISFLPLFSILEGCNQILKLYKFRFYQAIIVSFSICCTIYLNGNLWAGSISLLASVLTNALFILIYYKKFFIQLFNIGDINNKSLINWRVEIFPMQWRIAIATISWFFVYMIFVPLAFKYQGAVLAGQIGLTISIFMAIGNISFSWFTPKIPTMTALFANNKIEEFNKLFYEYTKITYSLLILAIVSYAIFIVVINLMDLKFADRLLGIRDSLILLVGYLFNFISAPFSHYMRAQKIEPIYLISLIGAILIAVCNTIGFKYYNISTVAYLYALINIIMTTFIYYIWDKNRKNLISKG